MSKKPVCKLVSVGRIQKQDGWHLKAHLHAFHEMIAILRGTHHVLVREEEITAAAGEVLFYPAGLAHEEWAEPGEPFEIVFVAFEWRRCPPELPNVVKDARGRLRSLLTWLLDEQGAYYPTAAELRERFLAAALAEYVRAASPQEHGVVEAVRAFIRENLKRPIQLAELARVAGLSRFHFVRAYKGLTGRTPMQEVRRMKLEAARNLLLTTNLPLKQIAPLVGFESEYHLSRLFRTHFGLGSRELRRRVRTG